MTDCEKEANLENESKMRNFENFENRSMNGKDQERRGEVRRDEAKRSEAKRSEAKSSQLKPSEAEQSKTKRNETRAVFSNSTGIAEKPQGKHNDVGKSTIKE
jgi:hypothetical protein